MKDPTKATITNEKEFLQVILRRWLANAKHWTSISSLLPPTVSTSGKIWRKVIASLMIPLFVLSNMPLVALAAPQGPAPAFVPAQVPQNPAHVTRGPHKLKPVEAKLEFSSNPSDFELAAARVFEEPLVPMTSAAVKGENEALAAAILSFKKQANFDDVSPLTQFMSAYPHSRWLPSLQSSVGLLRLHSGYFSEALALWRSAWQSAKDETALQQKAVADRALAQLLEIDSHLGRQEELESFLPQIEHRRFVGSSEQMIRSAKDCLALMKERPTKSFKCGPYAVNSILNVTDRQKGKGGLNQLIEAYECSKDGTTLAQVKQLADQVGEKLQLAKRSSGAPVAVPSLIHWRVGHFAAITAKEGERYRIADPTFGPDLSLSVTAQALDAETDGYSLIPQGPLPKGWSSIDESQAAHVSGKGAPGSWHDRQDRCGAPSKCCEPCGNCPPPCPMAQAGAWAMNAVLHIVDTPLGYNPPLGPPIAFKVNYNYLETDQPGTFTFTNLGEDWTLNWVSYLTVDGSNTATVRLRGGGTEALVQSGGVYSNDMISQALLVNTGTNAYQRQLPDGTIETYNLADSATPPHIFLTEVTDPRGNSALIQYDGNYRVISITDAINQVSTISYVSNTFGNAGFYKVSQITDPFGRSCSFTYDSATTTQLLSITDLIGLTSSFDYDSSSSFIASMTTPYGTTSFYQYTPPTGTTARGLRFNMPDGSSAVLESWLGVGHNAASYYWDREATALYPSDPGNLIHTHCETTGWLTNTTEGGPMEAIPDYIQMPLENKVSYQYPGESFGSHGITGSGTINKPILNSRPMNGNVTATIGGSKTTGDTLTINVIDSGLIGGSEQINYVVLSGDTLPSIAAAMANAINADTSLKNLGVRATVLSTVVTIGSQSPNSTYYSEATSGGATETIGLVSVSPQTAQFTVTGTARNGDILNILGIDPTGGAFWAANYFVTGTDTLNTIASNIASQINSSATHTNLGVTASAFSNNVFVSTSMAEPITYFVQNLTSGATETLSQVYDVSMNTQAYQYQWNAFGHPILAVDPAGRVFSYTYAGNNIDLTQITETRDGDNFMLGNWTYNSQHEPTQYVDGSAQTSSYSYNSSGQLVSITDPNSKVTSFTYTGTAPATVGGTKTTGDVLTITTHDSGLSGGLEAVNYTVLAGDTLTTIASGLASAINSDVNLQAIGVSASASSGVITLSSKSVNVTTYTKSLSMGATETITLGTNTFGFLTLIDGPLSGNDDVTSFTYDGYNRLASTTDSEGYTLNYSYDNANRPTQTSYPDGTNEQTIYDKLDAVFMKDRIGRWTENGFDSLRQLSFEIDPLGRQTKYGWCDCGSLKTLTDPAGNVTTWNHDLEGRPIQKLYADQSPVSYAYEPTTGRLLSKTDALQQTCRYFYNADNTMDAMGYSNAINATSNVVYAFDPVFRRLATVSSDWGTYTYTYNAYVTSPMSTPTTGGGRLQKVQNSVISNSDITYTYDVLGRTTNRSINGGSNSTTWSYDAMSRITSEANPLGTFNYAYVDDVSGSSKGTTRLASISYPNSQVTNFSWYGNTNDQRLQQISNLNPSGGVLSQFTYGYDPAGEITQWQQQQNGNSLNYNLGYDLAGQLTSAQAGAGNTPPAYAKEYYYSYDSASNRTGVQTTALDTARIGGSVTNGDTVTITVTDSGLSGGSEAVNYVVQSGDTIAKIALGLATAINKDSNLQSIGVSAFANASNEVINIKSASTNVTTYAGSASVGATETIAFGIFKNGVENAVIGGTKTTSDTLTIKVLDPALSGGSESVTYTVLAGDTINSIATGLKTAINSDSALSSLGCTATVASNVVSISSSSKNLTTYTETTSGGATETISLALCNNAPEIVLIAGSKTTGDVLTVVFVDSGLSGGKESVSYTVLSGDSLGSMTAALASAFNSDSALQNIGVSASASGTQITVQSNSPNLTSYRQSTSGGATESIGLTQPLYSWQIATIGGSKTTSDVLTVNVFDEALSGGKEAVSYSVLSGDTLTSIAAALASAINGDSNLSNVGVSASANSTVLAIESLSPNVTTYSQSVSAGATETITLGNTTGVVQSAYNNVNELVSQAPGGATRFQATTNKAVASAAIAGQTVTISAKPADPTSFSAAVAGTPTETVSISQLEGNATITIGGTITAGDVVSLTVADTQLANGPETVSHTVKSTDSTSSIASALGTAITNDPVLGNGGLGLVISVSSNVITSNPNILFFFEPCLYSGSVTGVPTEAASISNESNGNAVITIGGTVTIGDQVSVTVNNAGLSGGQEVVSYTAASGNTTTSIATALKNAINADTNLQNINVSATSSSAVISVDQAATTYTESVSGGATETITLGSNILGNSTAVIGGTKTTGDVLTLTAHNAQLSGGSHAVTYTVGSGDDLVKIAAGLASAVNADTDLQTLGVSASNSNAANIPFSRTFNGNGTLPGGASTANVSAVDGGSNTKTNGYAEKLNSGSSTSLTFDANGNMTSDGTNTYSWDAENRLLSIVYPGSGNHSDFTYDPFGRNVKIQEYTSSSLTSTKQFVWCGDGFRPFQPCEARENSSTVTAQYFPLGETISGTSYFYDPDKLGLTAGEVQPLTQLPMLGGQPNVFNPLAHGGLTRELTDSSGVIQGQLAYDPYGRTSLLQGSTLPDFQFAGYYLHSRSQLCLTRTRAYVPSAGRWLNRDPIQELGGVNLFAYVQNQPTYFDDPTGEDAHTCCLRALALGAGLAVGLGMGATFGGAAWVMGAGAGGIGAIGGGGFAGGAIIGVTGGTTAAGGISLPHGHWNPCPPPDPPIPQSQEPTPTVGTDPSGTLPRTVF